MVYYPNIFQWILTGGNASWSNSIASLGVFFNRFNNQDYSNGGVTEGSRRDLFVYHWFGETDKYINAGGQAKDATQCGIFDADAEPIESNRDSHCSRSDIFTLSFIHYKWGYTRTIYDSWWFPY